MSDALAAVQAGVHRLRGFGYAPDTLYATPAFRQALTTAVSDPLTTTAGGMRIVAVGNIALALEVREASRAQMPDAGALVADTDAGMHLPIRPRSDDNAGPSGPLDTNLK